MGCLGAQILTRKLQSISINRGILTGCNEAFIIDNETKKALINKDAVSEKIIKPILRGKDIKRYNYDFADQYVILAKFNSHKYLPQKYPTIYEHLKKYENRLKQRGQCRYGRRGNKGQHHWLELDNNPNCDYLAEFDKEKIIWKALGTSPAFHYIEDFIYVNDKANLLTSGTVPLKFICGIFNSKLFDWQFRKIGINMGKGFEYKIQSINLIAVPAITPSNKFLIDSVETLVDEIIIGKKDKSDKNTATIEHEIDQIIYKLYDLNKKEIQIIEN